MSLFCNFALSTYSLYFGYRYPVSCTQYINHMSPQIKSRRINSFIV